MSIDPEVLSGHISAVEELIADMKGDTRLSDPNDAIHDYIKGLESIIEDLKADLPRMGGGGFREF